MNTEINKKILWHSLPLEEVFTNLDSSTSGLSTVEAQNRLSIYGPNKLPEGKVDSYLTIWLRQFQNPLIYVLLLSTFFLILINELADASVIGFVLLINAFIGAFQEGKAKNIMKSLANFTVTKANVWRESQELVVMDDKITPGDVIVLRAGDKIPADARLIKAIDLAVDESSLTGESLPIDKSAGEINNLEATTADQTNMLFKGSFLVRGEAKAVVVSTGLETVIGKISQKLISLDNEDMPIKKDIARLSKYILILALIIDVVLFFAGRYFGYNTFELFKIIVSISVSVIPEGLPVVLTLVLSLGVWRMGNRKALVKKLQAVETLGQASVIAVDKTGTITKNELMVSSLYVGGRVVKVTGDGYLPSGDFYVDDKKINTADQAHLLLVGKIASFCANATVSMIEETKDWRVIGDPTEAALLILGQKLGFEKDVLEGDNPQVFDIPFNTKIKYHGTVHKTEDKYFLTIVGAPESIIGQAKFIYDSGVVRPITEDDKRNFKDQVALLSAQGLRVLVLAMNDDCQKEVTSEDLPPLTLVAICGMSDVVRLEVRASIAQAQSAGMKVVMITGDHRVTAQAIAETVGIFKEGTKVLTGQEIDDLSDVGLDNVISDVSVFARVTPEHKLHIIESYKRLGEVVAMTGDGVNDALSLVAADLGIGMGKIGTDVAKSASDIILLDDNFASIVAAIEEGRSIYRTIKKVLVYLLSTGLGEVLTIVGAIFLGLPIPITASQIIWLNFVTDGFLVAALAFDPKDDDLLKNKFDKSYTNLVSIGTIFRSIFMGSIMMIGSLLVFYVFYRTQNYSTVYLSTITLTVLAIFQWFNVFNCRSSKESVFSFKTFNNKYVLLSLFVVVASHVGVLYLPLTQSLLRVEPLSLGVWGVLLTVGLSVILFEELRKLTLKFV